MVRIRVQICVLLLMAAAALGGQAWHWEHFTYGEFVLAAAEHGSMVYIGTKTGLVTYNIQTQEKQHLTTANSPLPDNFVTAVAVSPSGTLWIGTEAGICRVDGDNWQYYNTANSFFPSNRISKLLVAWDGTTWALSRFNETYDYLYRFDGDNWVVIYHGNGFIPGQRINDITLGPTGFPWVAYYNTNDNSYGICTWNGSAWITHSGASLGIDNNLIYSLAHDGTLLWIGTLDGELYSYSAQGTTSYDLSDAPYYMQGITRLNVDSQGRLLVGYFSAMPDVYPVLLRREAGQWQLFDPNPQVPGLKYPNAVLADSSGDIWFGTSSGTAVFSGTGWTGFNCTASPMPSNYTNRLIVDPLDRLWLTIRDAEQPLNAVVRKSGEEWTVFDGSDSPLIQEPGQIVADSNGKIWFANTASSSSHTLVSYDGAVWQSFDASNSPLPSGYVDALTIDASDRLWVMIRSSSASPKRLFRYDGAVWTQMDSTDLSIRDMVCAADGNIWMATASGLLYWEGDGFSLFNTGNSGLTSNNIRCLELDAEGKLWIGMVNGLAMRTPAGLWQVWDNSTYGVPYRTYNDLAVDGWGRVWGATQSQGLVCFDGSNWTSYTTANSPILSNTVRQVACDAQQNLWLDSDWQGISRVALTATAADDPALTPARVDFALGNFPNPFNPSTTIKFQMPQNSSLRLEVFNLKGQLVRSLFSGTKSAGDHSVEFDGKDDKGKALASGIYYVRIASGSGSATRKILLLK